MCYIFCAISSVAYVLHVFYVFYVHYTYLHSYITDVFLQFLQFLLAVTSTCCIISCQRDFCSSTAAGIQCQ